MKFTDLDLCPPLLEGLKKSNFIKCSPVQEAVIPTILEGKDVSALAQTGTGKTGAFLIPLMEKIWRKRQAEDEENKWKKGHFVLVLVPTRELAEQVYKDVYKLRGELDVEAVSIYGGTKYESQKKALENKVEFVIGTPGRLIDLYKNHLLDLKQVQAVVFDEADRMFDMGFKEDMRFVLSRMNKHRQFLLFSATLNFDVLTTAYRFGADPVEFNLSKDEVKAENVDDEVFHVSNDEKPKYLLSILKKYEPNQTIIFSNFKNQVERIAQFLNDNKWPALGISSLLSQSQRNRVLNQFKSQNDRNILVATDVAARGLDIKGVDLVINFELPDDAENYVHRIGRTGRAGKKGKACSFSGDRDVDALVRIEEYLKHKLPIGWLEDGDLIAEFKEFPQEIKRNKRPKSFENQGHSKKSKPYDNKKNQRRSRPSSSNKNHKKRVRQDEDSRNEDKPIQDKPIHRDRKTGRHASIQRKSNASPKNMKRNLNGKRGRRTKVKKPTKQQSQGVLSKVQNFMKKLFS